MCESVCIHVCICVQVDMCVCVCANLALDTAYIISGYQHTQPNIHTLVANTCRVFCTSLSNTAVWVVGCRSGSILASAPFEYIRILPVCGCVCIECVCVVVCGVVCVYSGCRLCVYGVEQQHARHTYTHTTTCTHINNTATFDCMHTLHHHRSPLHSIYTYHHHHHHHSPHTIRCSSNHTHTPPFT